MALYATNRFPGDGTTTSYEFNFVGKYIDRSHVKAYQEDNVTWVRTPVPITAGNFLNDTTLFNLPVTPVGKTLVIYRDTVKAPMVDFVNGARFTEASLDTATRQGAFIAVECADALSPEGLSGLMDQLNGYSSAAEASSDQARAYAGQAAASASSGAASALAAATHALGAMNSKNLAEAAESSASISAAATAQDAATVAAIVTTATTAAAGAAEAFAQATALLGVGIGTSYIDHEGDLIMTYVPPVTSVYIDGDGNLSLEY